MACHIDWRVPSLARLTFCQTARWCEKCPPCYSGQFVNPWPYQSRRKQWQIYLSYLVGFILCMGLLKLSLSCFFSRDIALFLCRVVVWQQDLHVIRRGGYIEYNTIFVGSHRAWKNEGCGWLRCLRTWWQGGTLDLVSTGTPPTEGGVNIVGNGTCLILDFGATQCPKTLLC